MIYDVSNHPSLSGKASALFASDPAQAISQILAAETLLGVPLEPYTDRAGEQAALAVVYQLNYQLEWGIDPTILESVTSRIQQDSRSFKPGLSVVSPIAQALMTAVISASGDLAKAWGDGVPTLRGPSA